MNTSGPTTAQSLIERSGDIIDHVRANTPRVHCLTNEVAVTYSANALLAAGAVPSMTWQATEVAGFVSSSNSLVVNLGTLEPERLKGIHLAIDTAIAAGIPWLLDPVFVERSPPRLEVARELVERKPDLVRGNAAEHRVLDVPPDIVCVVSGAVDRIELSGQSFECHNGHPMMTRVTATGCAAGALLGACLAVCDDALTAAAAGTLFLGVAGEIASANAPGPGSLAHLLLDAISALEPNELMQKAKLS